MLHIRLENSADTVLVEALLDLAFGADRHDKTSYRYRTGIPPIAELCLVAEEEERLVGTIRYWPVRMGKEPVLLLDPIATEPERRAQGLGRMLVGESLARAADLGHDLVFLVGDPGYYHRFGFLPLPDGITMPGEDPARLQWRSLGLHELPVRGGTLLRVDEPEAAAACPMAPTTLPPARLGAASP